MLYTIITVGNTEYKLRLTAQTTVDVEKKLGKSVLDVLLRMAPKGAQDGNTNDITGMSMPFVSDIVTILHGSLGKYQHGITLDTTYELYDNYIDAGGSYMDFFGILQEILQVSGFLPKAVEAPQETAEQANVSAA
jgi:hypothetical protein